MKFLLMKMVRAIVVVDKVANDSVVVDGGCRHHVKVPDGVRERNPAVQLEKYHTEQVDDATRL